VELVGLSSPAWCARIPASAIVLGRYCSIERLLDDRLRHRCRLGERHDGPHGCWCGRSFGPQAAQLDRVAKVTIHVFHCPQVECRWARGLEYTDETSPDSFAAAVALCALDGRTTCPLETARAAGEVGGWHTRVTRTAGAGSFFVDLC